MSFFRVSAVAIGVLAMVTVSLYALSAHELGARFEFDVTAVPVSIDSTTVARGERLSRIHGCNSCHADSLGGQVLADDLAYGRLVAPNLTRVRDHYTDLDFVRLLRHGVRPDGTAVSPEMPSPSFAYLADDDLAAIIAYVRSVPPIENALSATVFGPALRFMVVSGQFEMAPELIDHEQSPPASVNRDDPVEFGRYLASTACTECHGMDLHGQVGVLTPDRPSLEVVSIYSVDQLVTLLRTGIAVGDRQLGLMTHTARTRFSHYTDEEIAALHAYLTVLRVMPTGG